MKTLFLTESLGRKMGGLSSSVLHLAICLSKKYPENEYRILIQKESNDEGIENDYLIPPNLTIERVSKIGIRLYPISFMMQFRLHIFNPDIVYIKGIWKQTSLAGYIWKKTNPNKILIVSPAGMLQPVNLIKRKILKKITIFLIEKPLLELSDAVHAVSENEKKDLLNLGFNINKIFYIPEGIPTLKKGNFKNKKNFAKELLFISRIAPIKGIDLFIEALKDIDFNGWRCSLYGPGEEDYIYEIKCLIKNKNLSDKVSLHKGVFGEEKYKLLQNASAFILPSYSEAFGIAIAEAMAFELPIVTTKTTPWNIIEKEKLGWYVNPSKNDLSKAIQELFYSKKEDLEEMGSKAKKIINKNFDWNETSEKIMKEIKILYNKN